MKIVRDFQVWVDQKSDQRDPLTQMKIVRDFRFELTKNQTRESHPPPPPKITRGYYPVQISGQDLWPITNREGVAFTLWGWEPKPNPPPPDIHILMRRIQFQRPTMNFRTPTSRKRTVYIYESMTAMQIWYNNCCAEVEELQHVVCTLCTEMTDEFRNWNHPGDEHSHKVKPNGFTVTCADFPTQYFCIIMLIDLLLLCRIKFQLHL